MRWAALMAILSQQPGASSSMNLNEQALQVYDEGVKASAFRASRINCTGTGVTCTQTGVTATLNVSGGGGVDNWPLTSFGGGF